MKPKTADDVILPHAHPVVQLMQAAYKGALPSVRAQLSRVLVASREAVKARKPSPKLHEDAVTALKALRPDLPEEYWPLVDQGVEAHEGATRPRRAPRAAQSTPGATTPRRRPSGPQDEVADAMVGMSLEQMYEYAAPILGSSVDELKAKYGHLNPGLQRMNLGNAMRRKK